MIATQTVRMRATLRDTDIQLFTRFAVPGNYAVPAATG